MNFIGLESSTKLRGGYYTDLDIAAFLARWVLQTRPKRVLEPSCGDGVFIAAIAQSDHSSLRDLVAFEIDPKEAAKARLRSRKIGPRRVKVLTQNFLEWSISNDDTL